ncbi:MAG: hypothetical protein LBH51_09230 [Treponema sp.]|jgi:hypothetical protein|nr:hypothetical protein [Treponema sp.]
MSKISSQDRALYLEKIKKYHDSIEMYLDKEKEILAAIKQDTEDSALKRLSLVEVMLNLCSYYLAQNGISQSVLKVKNEDALNECRKSIYKSVIYLEQIVTSMVDAPFSEYEKELERLAPLSPGDRYYLVRKMGLTIHLLENAFGENSKWKWAFVDLEGRYAAAAKNLIDLKTVISNTDPRSPNYAPTVYHLRLVKKLLMQAADRYRDRYELSTNRVNDFEMGIRFLHALHWILEIFQDREEAWTVSRKLDTWELKLSRDLQRDPSVKKEPRAGNLIQH